MPHFGAFAAYAATLPASLSTDPDDLATLAKHLRALRPGTRPAQRVELVDAHADVQDAENATYAARELSRGLARLHAETHADKLRHAAVQSARAAILAVEPTAARMRGTDMPVTPSAIRAAALAYLQVDASPEEFAGISTGTPVVQVHCHRSGPYGRHITAQIAACIRTEEWTLPAHPPILLEFERLDGRLNGVENARKLLHRKDPKKAYLRVTDVPVEYIGITRP
ncbi:hypothetical protein [Streptomyces subrutilus]|uniref:Uncharacterized protein n=1 Tax=Streptomyces subrutilus TaxID=36818 RepID=A0A1E5NXR9_9ACTN|nr:hypothetical protein [Streptomyces subrutilus]OEJ21040.1 hypothetical protein BGK67_34655 [Streptomyces subrutilus]